MAETLAKKIIEKIVPQENTAEKNAPEKITAKAPWLPSMDGIPAHLDYFEGSMFDKVEEIAGKYPNNIAFDFMNKRTALFSSPLRRGVLFRRGRKEYKNRVPARSAQRFSSPLPPAHAPRPA